MPRIAIGMGTYGLASGAEGVRSAAIFSEVPCLNKLFDLLFCEGCIAGPVIPNDLTFFERRRYIIQPF